jgi:hypothetical protein
MYHNPIGYALGLLDELEGAERAGREQTASEVRAELRSASQAALGVDPQSLDGDGKALLGRLRARMDALGAAAKAPEKSDADGESDGEKAAPSGRARTAKAAAAPESAVKPPPK